MSTEILGYMGQITRVSAKAKKKVLRIPDVVERILTSIIMLELSGLTAVFSDGDWTAASVMILLAVANLFERKKE